MEVKVSRRMAELLEKNQSFSGEVPTPDQAWECLKTYSVCLIHITKSSCI